MAGGWYLSAVVWLVLPWAAVPVARAQHHVQMSDVPTEEHDLALPARPVEARRAPIEEPWLVVGEGAVLVPLADPEARLFRPGGTLAISGYRPLLPWLLAGARLRFGLLGEGRMPLPPPTGNPHQADPGIGGLGSLSAALRLRFSDFGDDDGRRGTGPWLEVALGGLLTGPSIHAAIELALGWGIELGPIDLAPVVRYLHAFHSENDIDQNDAHILVAGVEVVFLDGRRAPPRAPPGRSTTNDQDHDGIVDAHDECPEEPEDRDGFQDEDGCPDPDNDHDGIPDATDHCPIEPEDHDGFEDTDGCPDFDNDNDGIPDDSDRCPMDPETVNGVDDSDGCPDEGVIQLVEDRVVIEESVLFDLRRSRIKHAARPVLQALANLIRQHPDWVRLRIEGHADVTGAADLNQHLSEERAQRVREYLVGLGVAAERIDSIGYGSSRPRDHGTTDEAYARNRRVEFVVLSRAGVTTPAPPQPTTTTTPAGLPQAHDTEVP